MKFTDSIQYDDLPLLARVAFVEMYPNFEKLSDVKVALERLLKAIQSYEDENGKT